MVLGAIVGSRASITMHFVLLDCLPRTPGKWVDDKLLVKAGRPMRNYGLVQTMSSRSLLIVIGE